MLKGVVLHFYLRIKCALNTLNNLFMYPIIVFITQSAPILVLYKNTISKKPASLLHSHYFINDI